MGLVGMICPQCGAKLDVEEGREYFFCQYCGTKITFEKQFVEMSGTVNVSGIATENSLLEKGNIQLQSGKFDDAKSTFERVLDINPKCSDAYLGKLLAELKLSDKEELSSYNLPIDEYMDFNNAIKYGSTNQQKELKGVSDAIIDRLMAEIDMPEEVVIMKEPKQTPGIIAFIVIIVLIIALAFIFDSPTLGALVVPVIFIGPFLGNAIYSHRYKKYCELLPKMQDYEMAKKDFEEYKQIVFERRYRK